MSRTLSGLFLVGALNRPRKRKRTNRENPRTIPSKSGKSRKNRESPKKDKKGQKRTKKDKKGRTSPDRETPRLKPPRLAALEYRGSFGAFFLRRFVTQQKTISCQSSLRRRATLTNTFGSKPLADQQPGFLFFEVGGTFGSESGLISKRPSSDTLHIPPYF